MAKFVEGQPVLPLARTIDEWREWATLEGLRPFHGTQVFKWIHEKRVLDPEQMTNLSKHARARLASAINHTIAQVADVHEASDGTRKLVLRMTDGSFIETVLIPMSDDDVMSDEPCVAPTTDAPPPPNTSTAAIPPIRVTQCISTQVGCAMRCSFCASGASGLHRDLLPDEIVSQILLAHPYLHKNERLSNVVVMGMGEPLHNYDATVRAVKLIGCPDGIGLSSRKITISTVGIVPGLQRLAREFQGHIGLAISLHAPDDETRSRLIPINRRYPIDMLMKELHDYPLPQRRRITIEYALINGQNDSIAMARKLIELLSNLPVKVNLIPLNPISAGHLNASQCHLTPSPMSQVLAFQRVLTDAGMSCFIRRSRGDSISAACGQLAGKRNTKPA